MSEEEEKLAKAHALLDSLYEQGYEPSITMHPNPNEPDSVIILVNGKEFEDQGVKTIRLPDEPPSTDCILCNGDPCFLTCVLHLTNGDA